MADHPVVAVLRTIPASYAQLTDLLQNGGAPAEDAERVTGGGGKAKPAPLQLDTAVLDARTQLVKGLRYYVVRSDGPLAMLPHTLGRRPAGTTDAVPHMCAWLLHLVPVLPASLLDEMHADLDAWQMRGHALTFRPPPPRAVLDLGPCPPLELYACPGRVRAHLPADRAQAPRLSCTGCGTTWDQLLDWPGAHDLVLPVAAVAELLGVTVRTVQRRAPDRTAGMVRLGDALDPSDPATVA